MATTTNSVLEKDMEALRRDVAALTASISQLTESAGQATDALGAKARKHVNGATKAGEDLMEHALRLGSHSGEIASEVATDALSVVTDQIKRNPVAAVVTALGLGFLAGTISNNK